MKTCSVCGREIPEGETYLKVCDNFLQARFFEEEDESDNVFCSDLCLMDALTVKRLEVRNENQ